MREEDTGFFESLFLGGLLLKQCRTNCFGMVYESPC